MVFVGQSDDQERTRTVDRPEEPIPTIMIVVPLDCFPCLTASQCFGNPQFLIPRSTPPLRGAANSLLGTRFGVVLLACRQPPAATSVPIGTTHGQSIICTITRAKYASITKADGLGLPTRQAGYIIRGRIILVGSYRCTSWRKGGIQ